MEEWFLSAYARRGRPNSLREALLLMISLLFMHEKLGNYEKLPELYRKLWKFYIILLDFVLSLMFPTSVLMDEGTFFPNIGSSPPFESPRVFCSLYWGPL